MTKIRVPLWGKPGGFAAIDPDATRGAVIGKDVFWPSGQLYVPTAGGGAPPVELTWTAMQSIPANVTAVAGLSAAGFVRRSGAGWSASAIANTDLAGADTDGLAEGAVNRYFTDERAQDAIAGMLRNTATVTWSYNDAGDELRATAEVAPDPTVAVAIEAGVATLDCSLGRIFTLNLTANATLAITNRPASDCLILRVSQAGAFALTLPGYVTPKTGAYATTASGTELIGLLTVDGTNFDAVVLK